MAAGLVAMVARASNGHWHEAGGVIGQAETFRARVAPLAQADAEAYEEALSALRGREELAERYRDQQLRDGLEAAARDPVRIAEAGCDLASLAALLVENGNPRCAPTPPSRAFLAESGARVAATLVETNLGATRGRSAGAARRVARRSRRGRVGTRARRSGVTSYHPRMAQPDPNQEQAPQRAQAGLEPARRRRRGDLAPGRVARRGHARVGVGRLDRQGRSRLHPRQRRRRRTIPLVGEVQRLGRRRRSATDDEAVVDDDTEGDLCGHGTACAGIVRSLAPDCELTACACSAPASRAAATSSLAGLRWAVEQGFDVVNMSLSTTKRQFAGDPARAHRPRLLPAHGARRLGAQHARRELPVALLLGHLRRQPRGAATRSTFFYNPDPPVEFFARGVDVEVAWTGGGRIRCTGNSFATPHMTGICALVLGKHPELTPFQLKSVLYLTVDERGRRSMSETS